MCLATFIWALVMLKYYYDKLYQVAFWTLAASTVTALFQSYLFYNVLTTRELTPSYLITTLLVLATGVLYALSLTFSRAGERLWLKAAGILQVVLGATMILSFTWAVVSVSARVNGTIETLEQWITLISGLIPVVFILNFLSERATAAKTEAASAGIYTKVIGIASLIAFVSAFFFVPRFLLKASGPWMIPVI